MARRRHFHPDQDLVHVSFKCVGDAFLMRPDAYTSFVIASALEQAAEKYGVRIHAFCFLSNHAHLLLGIQGCRLDSFMQYLKSLIALALNLHRERDGGFFKRRYRVEPILSSDAAVGIEQYVHQQALSPRVGTPDPAVAQSSLALLHRLHARAGRACGRVAGAVLVRGGDRGARSRRGELVRRGELARAERSSRRAGQLRAHGVGTADAAAAPRRPVGDRAPRAAASARAEHAGRRGAGGAQAPRRWQSPPAQAREVHDAGPERRAAGPRQEAVRAAALRARHRRAGEGL